MGATPPWTRVRHTLLGSQEFVDRLGGRLGLKAAERGPRDRPSHRARLRAAFPTRVVEDRSSRDERIRELRRAGRYSVAEIARHLGLHRATVFRISSTDPPAMQHRRGQVSKCRME
jgi:hypothetical protein